MLTVYIQSCHDSGIKQSIPQHAVLAIQKTLQLRRKLPRCWNSLKAWQLSLPSAHRTPLPLDFLQVLFATALEAYLAGSISPLLLPFAVLIRAGFFALLRPLEIITLKRRDVWVGTTAVGEPIAVLVLRNPKNRASMGLNQFVVLHEVGSVLWLEWLMVDLHPDANLWPSSAGRLRSLFASVLKHAGLGEAKFTPGCLRPGGATWRFIQGTSVAELQFIGRWKSLHSLTSYIQEAMCHMVWLQLSHAQQLNVAQVVAGTAAVWSSPPGCTRTAFGPLPLGWRRPPRSSHKQQTSGTSSWQPPGPSGMVGFRYA